MYRRKTARGLPFLPLIFIGLLAFAAFKFYPVFLGNRLGNFDRFNLVVAGPKVSLVSLDMTGKTLTIVRFPADLYLTGVIHGYGKYQIASVYPAGEIDGRGGETLAGTVREYLGVTVDGYYYSQAEFSDPKKFFLSPDFIFKAKSDLAFFDRIKFVWGLEKVRFDKVTDVDLGKFSTPIILADGTTAQFLDGLEADSVLNGFFAENRIRDENLRVQVVNTTPTMGIGARAVRLLANIGLSVVNIDSTSSLLPNCRIEASENAVKSTTAARIAKIYSCQIFKKADEGRAAVTIFLGQDFADWLQK